jgi:hypothetical protein
VRVDAELSRSLASDDPRIFQWRLQLAF